MSFQIFASQRSFGIFVGLRKIVKHNGRAYMTKVENVSKCQLKKRFPNSAWLLNPMGPCGFNCSFFFLLSLSHFFLSLVCLSLHLSYLCRVSGERNELLRKFRHVTLNGICNLIRSSYDESGLSWLPQYLTPNKLRVCVNDVEKKKFTTRKCCLTYIFED